MAAIEKASGDKEVFMDEVIFRMLLNQNDSSLAIKAEDQDALKVVGTIGIIGSILTAFTELGNEILSSIIGNATSFYAQMFFYRVVLQMLHQCY